MPIIDDSFLGIQIKHYLECIESDGAAQPQFCKGLVVGLKSNNKVHISWGEKHLCDRNPVLMQQKLIESKWKKHLIFKTQINTNNLLSCIFII